MRKNEHPSCSCYQCKRGKRSAFGHFMQRHVARRLRRAYRVMLRLGRDEPVAVRSPYMD